jgi:hypothetical protein
MRQRLPKPRILLGAMAVVLWVTQPTPVAAEEPFEESEIRDLVEGLQNGTLRPSFASEQCQLGLRDNPQGEDLREITSGYLDVPPETALPAFCDALVRVIQSRTITLESLLTIVRKQGEAAGFLEVGRLLRAIYFSHLRASTASLKRTAE